MAFLGSVLRIQNSNSNGFYIASESASNRFYYVEYKDNYNFCTCGDYASNRSDKCKHIFPVDYAIRLNLIQHVEKKLPISQRNTTTKVEEQYKNESIRTLNILEKVEIGAEQYDNIQRQSWELDDYSF